MCLRDRLCAPAYAKRGQVLLAEKWAVEHPEVKFVSSHPGWTATAAVDKAYGDSKSYLEPMRSTWEGAEGIAWLAAVPGAELQSGGFYLDRSPQAKHMAGAFFSEVRATAPVVFSRLQPFPVRCSERVLCLLQTEQGSFTKNSDAEVDILCITNDGFCIKIDAFCI